MPEYAVAAIIDSLPGVATMNELPRVTKALRGCRRAMPPRWKAPVCKEIMCGRAAQLMGVGKTRIALLVAMTFLSYCRPGGASHGSEVAAAPAGAEPQNELPGLPQAVTKTGVVDDAVIVDQPP